MTPTREHGGAEVPQHVPVMVSEVLEGLALQPGHVACDGTFGAGGHSLRMVELVGPTGLVVAMDRDPHAIEVGQQRFGSIPNLRLINASYHRIRDALEAIDAPPTVDAILLDLGLSSDQLADPQRGFSYDAEGELDLRFDPERGEPAWRLIQHLPEKELADLIYTFGEERYSRRIARKVVEVRRGRELRQASEFARLVRSCVPRTPGLKIDPATRTFQALRIAVNRELEILEEALGIFPEVLRSGGRLAIISFHSLEDRIVKQAIRGDPRYTTLTKKPIRPNEAEVRQNPRSRSARLRIAQRT